MRRLALIGLLLGVTAGCTYGSGPVAYQSTLFEPTLGVALRGAATDLYSTEGVAQVGMAGTTCVVDVAWAGIGNDYDYPGTDEVVQDAGTLNGADVVVISSDHALHIQHGTDWDVTSNDYPVPSVREASIAGNDVAALVDDGIKCQVDWVQAGTRQVLRSGSCDVPYALTADPTTGDAFVGSVHGIYRVRPGHTEVLTQQPSQLVAWDDTAGVLYAATAGDSVLRALAPDGTLIWSVDVGAAILGLDDLGTLGSAAVTLQQADGSGGIALIDGQSGAITDTVGTPTAVPVLKGSPDGRSLALVDVDQVHFYKVANPLDASSGSGNGGSVTLN